MASTEKLQHPIPDQNRLEWYDQFVSLVSSLDEADFSGRDDRNIAIFGGGTFAFDSAGTVTWSDDVTFRHGSTGFNGVLPQETTGITLEDGDFVYVDVVRGPAGLYNLTAVKTQSALPATNKSYAFLARLGNVLWVRHLGFLPLGGTFSSTSTVLNSGEKITTVIPFVSKGTQGSGLQLLGRFRFDTDDYEIANATRSMSLRVEVQVSEIGLSGDLEFYDATSGDVLKASTSVSSEQPVAFEASFTEEASGDRVYELRAGLDPAGGPYDPDQEIIVWHAAVEVVNTF